MNFSLHPTDGSPKTCCTRAKEFARRGWRQALWAVLIAGGAAWIVGHQQGCGDRPNFAALTNTDQRKAVFVGYLAPMVKRANQEVAVVRTRLLAINAAMTTGMAPEPRQRDFVRATADKYGLGKNAEVDQALMTHLLERVDALPVSLVVAQAAIESGWGTSRFARKGNNFFGMRDYSESPGMVPRARDREESFEIRIFSDACDAVRAYMLNLNADSRYRELRALRGQLRAKGEVVTGEHLADGLRQYSSRRDEYVEDVKGLIASNKLDRLDTDGD